jgi:O-antigen ligase
MLNYPASSITGNFGLVSRQRQRPIRSAWSSWLSGAPQHALILWGFLWLNLDTGLLQIQVGHNLDEWVTSVRAALGFVVLPLAAIIVTRNYANLRLLRTSPSRLLFIYGSLAAVATVFSPQPWWAAYWSVAFLATMLAAWLPACTRTPLRDSRTMLQASWVVTLVVTVIIAHMAQNSVFGAGASGEGVFRELDGATRASGVARWAAVPGLVCLLRAYNTRRPILIAAFLSAASFCFYIVYRMQSRGAVIGCLFAVAFSLLCANRFRKYALPFLLFAIAALLVTGLAGSSSEKLSEYLHRGQSEEEYRSMTGRTDVWRDGFEAFREAPLLGRGQWTDRLVLGGQHVHNSYLQALLNAGVIGFVPYIGSWIAGWVLFFRILKRRDILGPEDRHTLMEAGAVMAFFTVRSVPETTTASFAVDLLVMAAVFVYLEMLAIQVERFRGVTRFSRFETVRVGPIRLSTQATRPHTAV